MKTRWISTAIFLFTGLFVLVHLQEKVESAVKANVSRQELLYVPSERMLHWMALGDDATAADLLWLRSIFYIAGFHDEVCHQCGFHHHEDDPHVEVHHHDHSQPEAEDSTQTSIEKGYHLFQETDFRDIHEVRNLLFGNLKSEYAKHLYKLLDTSTNLDSLFAIPYYEGAMNLGLNFGRYDEAIALIEKGRKALPNRWEMYYYSGFIKLFYLNDKENAALDLRLAALKPNAPLIVVQHAAAVQVGAGMTEMALEFLRTLHDLTGDDYMKKKIEDMLAVYGAGMPAAPVPVKKDMGKLLDSLFIEL